MKKNPTSILFLLIVLTPTFVACETPEEQCNGARIEAHDAWMAYRAASRTFRDTAELGPEMEARIDSARMSDHSAFGLVAGPGPGPSGAERIAEQALHGHATAAWEAAEAWRPAAPAASTSSEADEAQRRFDEGVAATREALSAAVDRSEAAYNACRLVDP